MMEKLPGVMDKDIKLSEIKVRNQQKTLQSANSALHKDLESFLWICRITSRATFNSLVS